MVYSSGKTPRAKETFASSFINLASGVRAATVSAKLNQAHLTFDPD